MGVESTAILLRWIHEPATRPFDLKDLTVITSQVGEEYEDTGRDMEHHLFPLLAKHRIRTVQVARAGHLEADGITVLSDTRTPERCHIEGAYRLSDELMAAGTVPQFGGEHRCSLKFKAFVIESWLKENVFQNFRHAFGFNADETRRAAKSDAAISARIAFGFNRDEERRAVKGAKYDTPHRQGWYPLIEWGWSRETCRAYIKEKTGVFWQKSCCTFCPFTKLHERAVERHKAHPEQVARALLLEHVSLSINPRGQLYKKTTLRAVTAEAGNTKALKAFERELHRLCWNLYRVRRIYTAKGKAYRCVEVRSTGFRARVEGELSRIAEDLGLELRDQHGIAYGYARERASDAYPAAEEYYVAGPAVVQAKTRYGLDWFEAKWATVGDGLYCGPEDGADNLALSA